MSYEIKVSCENCEKYPDVFVCENCMPPKTEYGKALINIDSDTVIICSTTGILCEAKVGGHSCLQMQIEGFPLAIYHNGLDFDDCKWGCSECHGRNNDDKYLEDYGNIIDKFLSESVNIKYSNFAKYKFDFERKGEVKEGCWPVLATFRGMYLNTRDTVLKGYMYMGNCD